MGWWKAETNFLDQIGANNGSPVGDTSFGAGKAGQAFVLDGHTDWVNLGNPTPLRLQDFTIELWVQRLSLTDVSQDATSAGFFGYGGGGYILGIRDDGHPFLSRTGVSDIPSTASIDDLAFHHLAVTKSGANVIFYLDGVAYPAPAYNPVFTFTSNAGIGSNPDSGGNGFLGKIDEVAVYNRALAGAEIQAIYAADSSGKCVSGTAPTITVQPSSQGVTAGTNATFSVLAAGTPALLYQWRFNGTNIAQGTNYLLTITNVQLSVTGSYQAVISNAYGSITSSPAILTVVSPPVINDQPQDVYVLPGGTATFLVGASGSFPLSFRWQHAGTNLPGAVNYSLIITNCQIVNTGAYRVVVSNSLATVTSTPASLILLLPPAISNQPTSILAPIGANLSFNVGATGFGPLSYQWRLKGTNLNGATNSSLLLSDAQLSGPYSVLVSNPYGGTLSSNAILTLTNPVCISAPTGLVAWWQGEGTATEVLSGQAGIPIGNAGYANGKVGQGFSFDGRADIVDVGNPSKLQMQNFTIDAWIQRSSLTNVSLDATSAGLFGYGFGGYIFGILSGGQLFLSKDGISQVQGGQVTDSVFHHVAVAKNGTVVTFYVDGVGLVAGAYDPGFTFGTDAAIGGRSDNLGNSFLGKIDEVGVYNRALSTGEVQTIYYATRQGRCMQALSIFQQPTNQTVVVGSNTLVSAGIAGTSPISYQWRLNGANVSAGTTPNLAINGATYYHAGDYNLFASNSLGSVTSAIARLTVLPKPLFTNGSFESGTFAGWVTNDISVPITPLSVRSAGFDSGFGFFTTMPTDGSKCLTCGFDGNGPGRIRAALDVMLPPGPSTLTFDYRLAWDMLNYSGATQPRTFSVVVEPFGGGSGLWSNVVLTAAPGTSDYDTGDLNGAVDLSAFGGTAIRISFDINIPEAFTGPGFFQLDNVKLSYSPSPTLAARKSGTNIVLSWPGVFTNFVVLTSSNVTPTDSWMVMDTNLIIRGATNATLTDTWRSSNKFYRLRTK